MITYPWDGEDFEVVRSHTRSDGCVAALERRGTMWRAVLPGGRIFAARYPGETERHWRGARWWAIDETETPCAWPVVTEVSRG